MKTKLLISIEAILRISLAGLLLFMAVNHGRAQSLYPQFPFSKKDVSYFGYEVSMGIRSFTLQSDIAAINGMQVQQTGASVGVNLSNQIGKVRATASLFYSDASVAHTVDGAEIGLSGNLYLLRLAKVNFHAFEPYLVATTGYQRSKFFGAYLPGDAVPNYSVAEFPALGQISRVKAGVGMGVEWQLRNDTQHFIHLFSEVVMSTSLATAGSNVAFAKTSVVNPLRFTVGLSFGLSRY